MRQDRAGVGTLYVDDRCFGVQNATTAFWSTGFGPSPLVLLVTSHHLFSGLPPQVAYLYTKVRSEFGKHCSFKDVPAFLLETVPCSTEYDDNYVARNPSVAELDTSPHMSGKSATTYRMPDTLASLKQAPS